MSTPIGSILLTPGVIKNISLANIPNIQGIKFTNGTPFDCTIAGFGVIGSSIIPAGTEYMLHSDIYNSGYISILAVNNAGVTGNGVVNLVVYDNGEPLPKGTWPISIPTQTVAATVSTVQTLSNEGAAVGTLVIDIGPSGNLNIVQIWNDHFSWSVVQSGVAHTVLQGQASGNPLLIGKSGDISEILGNLLVDGTATVNGAMTVGGGFTLSGGDVNLGTHNILTGNNITVSGNVGSATMSTTGLGNFNTLQSGGYLQNAGDADINGHKVLNVAQLKFNNGNLIAGINCGTFTAGALTGTQAHGLVGTPSVVMIGGADTSGTTTSAAFSYTTTQFSWRVNNSGQVMAWLAMKFA